jgi:altronate dehydratase
VKDFDEIIRRGGDAALKEASRFFMGTDAVHTTLRSIAARLDELEIAYAVSDGMAMVAHGCGCATPAVEVLLTAAGHNDAKREFVGLGWLYAHPTFGIGLALGLHRVPLLDVNQRFARLAAFVAADDAGGGHRFDQPAGPAVADRQSPLQ